MTKREAEIYAAAMDGARSADDVIARLLAMVVARLEEKGGKKAR